MPRRNVLILCEWCDKECSKVYGVKHLDNVKFCKDCADEANKNRKEGLFF